MSHQINSFLAHEDAVIVLIDAMELRRAGLAYLLKDWIKPGDTRVLSFASAEDLAGSDVGARCRLLILSIGSGEIDSPNVHVEIEQSRAAAPSANLVILSEHVESSHIVSAFRLGAQGYISMGTDPSVAMRAMNFIMHGGSFFPPHALADLSRLSRSPLVGAGDATSQPNGSIALPMGLTSRQRDVLGCLRLGKSNKQIARELDMQEATVKVHIRQIMRKLGVSNRTQAALQASQLPEDILNSHCEADVAQSELTDLMAEPSMGLAKTSISGIPHKPTYEHSS